MRPARSTGSGSRRSRRDDLVTRRAGAAAQRVRKAGREKEAGMLLHEGDRAPVSCRDCWGPLIVEHEQPWVGAMNPTGGEMPTEGRSYRVSCKKCGKYFVYDTRDGRVTPAG